jgi:hypothetical protein
VLTLVVGDDLIDYWQMQFSDFDDSEQQRSYLQLFAKGEDGQILTSPRWRLMLQGVGQRQ